MTEIPLRPECITNPIRLDLAEVEAMMLWPDDPAARNLWCRAAMLQEGASAIDVMPADLLRTYAKEALAIPRLEELNARIGKRHPHGLIAGIIVLEATVLAKVEPAAAALRTVQKSLSDRLRGTFQIEPRTMNNKAGPIYRFRPVSHLWAAYVLACGPGDNLPFPCRLTDLPMFLATADAIRKQAERTRAPKANATVMRPGEAVCLPPVVAALLPDVALGIAPRFPETSH